MDDFTYAPDPRRKPRQLTGAQITFAMIIAFGLILAINFSGRIAAGQPLQERFRDIQEEVELLRAEQATLVAVRDYSQSDGFVEQWARGEGKMIRGNEILIVPVPAAAPVAAQPTPVPAPVVPVQTTDPQPENWMLWWQLFFDAPPPG
ncbi:MAG: hypothetical protein AAF787_05140 [Chloroflexota bacterium]